MSTRARAHWSDGQTVHRTISGQDNLGNGAYAIIQFLDNSDLSFNSIGGATRVHYAESERVGVKQ
jgi:hypothetical protein